MVEGEFDLWDCECRKVQLRGRGNNCGGVELETRMWARRVCHALEVNGTLGPLEM